MADMAALADRVEKARASLRSKGGNATLRFSVCGGRGWQTTNSALVSEVLCELWNAAPDILAEIDRLNAADAPNPHAGAMT